MTAQQPLGAADTAAVIKLAIMAVGGQGGGVLTGWIEALARAEGYACQATSVAGVAQRTGATIYYVEMAPAGPRTPIFALAPAPGDVDILIAAEMMEAGRAIQRGFVTPDRTVLIASSHRALAVSEKTVPGDGIADAGAVRAAADSSAMRFLCRDMQALAEAQGSVISASLFGALAASGALPFPRAAFEAAIRTSGRGVEASLRAFAAGFDACGSAPPAPAGRPAAAPRPQVTGPARALRAWQDLADRAAALPGPAGPMAMAGLRKVVEFMDAAYGRDYLDRVETFARLDPAPEGELTVAAAKYIANAMAYDDVIRVAELKTRAPRRTRIAGEMTLGDGQLMQVTEFLHPRAEEIVGMLPAGLGRRLARNPRAMARIDRWFGRGRRMRSDHVLPFALLYALGALKRYRRRSLRHAEVTAHLRDWLGRAERAAQADPALAAEILRCQRLIKGYSDTHARGQSKFARVLSVLDRPGGEAATLRRLRETALQDEDGTALDAALAALPAPR